MIRVYLIKIIQKLVRLGKKCLPPMKVLSSEQFYKTKYSSEKPNSYYFNNRKNPKFYFNPSDYETYANYLKTNHTKSVSRTLKRADDAVSHKFDLLGSGLTFLGKQINWHKDFISGKSWNNKHHTKIQIINSSDDSDIKIPWELSRLQHFTDLGKAFWLTEDEEYLREFVSTVQHWEKENIIGYGPNWTCSMEVAIRAINIIWGLYFFSSKNLLTDEFVQNTIRFLYYHGLHIEKNLETIDDGSNNNHLLSNYLGLFYIGLLFPEFDRSQKWRQIACEGLEKEIILETNDDGGNYECSTAYHRLVLEIFLSAYILGKKNNYLFSETYSNLIQKMLHFSESITSPTGKTQFIGDNDDGFIIKLSHDDPSDHSHLIEFGGILFGRPLPNYIRTTEESLFYFGINQFTKAKAKINKSFLFKSSGYAVIRTDKLHMLFTAPKLTTKALGGHKHNDNLAFTLEYNKISYFIDPGTFSYTSNFATRNLNRSVLSHNTVSIDSEEQNKIIKSRPFFLFDESKSEIDLWANTKDNIIVSGFHRGYEKSKINIQHRRTILVNTKNSNIEITDEFTGDSTNEHLFETRFITPVENVVVHKNNQICIQENEQNYLNMQFDDDSNFEIEIVPSEYYPRYGVSKPAQTIIKTQRTKLPLINKTIISLSHIDVTKNVEQKTSNRLIKIVDSIEMTKI